MSSRSPLRRWWRVPVVALLGGLIAYAGSFLIEPQYRAETRLLIRGRDATFLTTTGQDLTNQPGVIDASLSRALAETQAGVATSREVATQVVDQLRLDQPAEEDGGVLGTVAGAFGTAYRCGKAILSFGFCADPEPREAAIQTVQGNIEAHQLGASTGETTGQPGSYILEISAAGNSPEQARAVTDATADTLVDISAERFRADAQAHADYLAAQVATADTAVADAATAIGDHKAANGISDAQAAQVLGQFAGDDTEATLRSTEADLAAAQAQLAALNASLATISPTEQTEQAITTGRSATGVTTEGPNAAYNDLLVERAKLESLVASLQGKHAALTTQLSSGTASTLTPAEAQLVTLDQQLSLAKANQAKLTDAYQDALVNASSDTAELTRIDTASLPIYPESPKRYLFLLLGVLLGALAGAGLTWLAERPTVDEDDDASGSAADRPGRRAEIDLRDRTPAATERVPVSVGADASLFTRHGDPGNGNGHGVDGAD